MKYLSRNSFSSIPWRKQDSKGFIAHAKRAKRKSYKLIMWLQHERMNLALRGIKHDKIIKNKNIFVCNLDVHRTCFRFFIFVKWLIKYFLMRFFVCLSFFWNEINTMTERISGKSHDKNHGEASKVIT